MKKLLLIAFFTVTALSCSSDDDKPNDPAAYLSFTLTGSNCDTPFPNTCAYSYMVKSNSNKKLQYTLRVTLKNPDSHQSNTRVYVQGGTVEPNGTNGDAFEIDDTNEILSHEFVNVIEK